MHSLLRAMALTGVVSLPLFALAHAGSDATITQVFAHAIPNIPGKSLKALVVEYPPGSNTPAHRHAPSAFIYAHVLSGSIRSQVDGAPARVYKAGEGFYETPGAHHGVSENASKTQPAKLLAIFVVDTDDTDLTTLDPKK